MRLRQQKPSEIRGSGRTRTRAHGLCCSRNHHPSHTCSCTYHRNASVPIPRPTNYTHLTVAWVYTCWTLDIAPIRISPLVEPGPVYDAQAFAHKFCFNSFVNVTPELNRLRVLSPGEAFWRMPPAVQNLLPQQAKLNNATGPQNGGYEPTYIIGRREHA
jgi:hypothetical protein